MARFLFIANDVPRSPVEQTSALQIADELLGRGFWAFTEAAPLRAKLETGDRILIYLAGQSRREFVASTTVASPATTVLPGSEQASILAKLGLSFMPYMISLRDVERFATPVKIRPLIPNLTFMTEKKNYGLHLRLPIVRINPEDYQLVLNNAHTATANG